MAGLVEHLRRYGKAYQLTAAACMGSIFYGWDIGLIGGVITIDSYKTYFGVKQMNSSQQANFNGNVVSILQGGAFFGALSTFYLSSAFGRKSTLLGSGIVYVIGSVLQSIVGLGSSTSTAVSVLYFSRFVGGFGVGMVSALVPTYVSESVPKVIRGRCTGTMQLANNIGIMLSYWVNYSANRNIAPGNLQWRVPFIVQIVPGVLFTIGMLFQPESPRWLVEHGNRDRAAASLARSAGTTPDDPAIQLTLVEIEETFTGKARASLPRQLLMMGESRLTALRCFIPSLVMFMQQWTGTNAVNYYSPSIFASLGLSSTNSGLFATGIYGVVKVVAVATILLFAVEGLGRKKCLIIGGLGQGLMMLWLSGFVAIHPENTIVPASYVSIVAVYLYAVFYCVGWGPVPWVVASEVVPNHVRTAALAVAVAINWLFSFTISKVTPIMLNNIHYGTFLIFGLCCIAMAVWAYALLPETTGVALEDVHYLFEDKMIVRALQDAPLGRIFLGGKRARPIEELRENSASKI
ncbi:general substrate transporter [Vararia minispora EC-137]|uniref:General substrate transporter n=1 Tax=Vararia minispora EC-137 TaxID=1314806 RepID=A0ACB8QSF8_9AGAM|nr:general substrate transporter [Vararia minispora EC-137]